MNYLKKEIKFCDSCMEVHEVATVEWEEKMTYKNEVVESIVRCDYCSNLDVYVEDEDMMRLNSSKMKESYNEKIRLNNKKKEGSL